MGDTEQSGPVTCPPGLKLTTDQISSLQIDRGMKEWQIDIMVSEMVAKLIAGDKKLTIPNWRKYIVTSVMRDFASGNRPKKPIESVRVESGPIGVGEPGQDWHDDGYWYYPLKTAKDSAQ
jgi:hypothetical protein